MLRRALTVLPTLIIAAGILSYSLLRASSVNNTFNLPSSPPTPIVLADSEEYMINYTLPDPGSILPDNPLWPITALKDRVWLMATLTPLKKAELELFYADKRLGASYKLFELGKYEAAFSTLTKAEKYLYQASTHIEEAKKRGEPVGNILERSYNSSLKHRGEIDKILEMAPEETKPDITRTQDYAKESYKMARDGLNELGLPTPENPFNTE